VPVPGGTLVVFVLSMLALLRVGRGRRAVGVGLGMSAPLWARRTSEQGEIVSDGGAREGFSDEVARRIGVLSGAKQVSRAIERAASGEGAVGPTTTVGDHAVIPLLETYAQGGFGGGAGGGGDGDGDGGGGGGGGGGGLGRSRTIAVAIVGPDGVKIRPVVDVTGLVLPAAGAIAALLMRGAGRRRRR
jgi:uncharacterized spore protein YtfJ